MKHTILTRKDIENMKLSEIKELARKPSRLHFGDGEDIELQHEVDQLTEVQHHFGWGD